MDILDFAVMTASPLDNPLTMSYYWRHYPHPLLIRAFALGWLYHDAMYVRSL